MVNGPTEPVRVNRGKKTRWNCCLFDVITGVRAAKKECQETRVLIMHHVGIGPSKPIDRIQYPVVHFQHDLYFQFQWQMMGMGAGNRCATQA